MTASARTAAREAGTHPDVRRRAAHQRAGHHRSNGLHGAALREALIADGFTDDEARHETGGEQPEQKPAPPAAKAPPKTPEKPAGPNRAAPRGSSSRRPGKYPKAAAAGSSTTSGALLALVAYPLVLATITHGPAGAKAWLRAKFLNQTGGATGGSGGSGKAPGVSGTPGVGKGPSKAPQPGKPWYHTGPGGTGTGA